jgi:hypothetical protein
MHYYVNICKYKVQISVMGGVRYIPPPVQYFVILVFVIRI